MFAGFSLEVMAPNGATLILGRSLHGIGSAAVFPAGVAILLSVVPSERRSTVLGGYFGLVGAVVLIAELFKFPVDPLKWTWALSLYIAIGVVTLFVVGTRLVEFPDEDTRRPLDVIGMILMAGAVGSFLFVVTRIQSWGWIDGRAIALLVVSPLFAFLLVYHLNRSESSMLTFEEAMNRNVLFANSAAIVFTFGFSLLSLALSEFIVSVGNTMVNAEHISSLIGGAIAGLLLLPFWIGRLADRRGHRQYIFAAGMCFLAVSLWLGQVGSEWSTSWWMSNDVMLNSLAWFGALIVFAVGAGMGRVSLIGAAVRSFSPKNLSVGVAFHQTFVSLGGAFVSIAILMLWERVGFSLGSYQAWLFGVTAVAGAIVMLFALGIDTRPRSGEPGSDSVKVEASEAG